MLIHQRIDYAGALVALIVAKGAGAKNVRLKDFVPNWDRLPSTDDDVIRSMAKMMEDTESQPSPPSSST